jgi:hypothetical protein
VAFACRCCNTPPLAKASGLMTAEISAAEHRELQKKHKHGARPTHVDGYWFDNRADLTRRQLPDVMTLALMLSYRTPEERAAGEAAGRLALGQTIGSAGLPEQTVGAPGSR